MGISMSELAYRVWVQDSNKGKMGTIGSGYACETLQDALETAYSHWRERRELRTRVFITDNENYPMKQPNPKYVPTIVMTPRQLTSHYQSNKMTRIAK